MMSISIYMLINLLILLFIIFAMLFIISLGSIYGSHIHSCGSESRSCSCSGQKKLSTAEKILTLSQK